MTPRDETEVVDIVRGARARRRRLEIVSGGTRRGFGRPMQCDGVLDMSGLSGIVTYEPEELILTVKPATPLAEIEAALSARGQRLGFEPQDWRALLGTQGTPTIGGAVASNANGPAAIRFGRARDHLLGFRAVNGLAEAYKAGGRVVKNVTGFDVPKLMCGAMGTLGPMTEMTFRVFPRTRERIFAASLPAREGFALLRRVWSSPLEATALCCANGKAYVRLDGALEEKAAMLRGLGDFAEAQALPGPGMFADVPGDVWRLTLAPSQAFEPATPWFADKAGAELWLSGPCTHPAASMRGGAPVPPEPPARTALTRAVKAVFDPLGLFNPGRMFEGI